MYACKFKHSFVRYFNEQDLSKLSTHVVSDVSFAALQRRFHVANFGRKAPFVHVIEPQDLLRAQ